MYWRNKPRFPTQENSMHFKLLYASPTSFRILEKQVFINRLTNMSARRAG